MIFKAQQVLKIKTNFDLQIGCGPIKMPRHAPLEISKWIKITIYLWLCVSRKYFQLAVMGDAAELKRHISVDYFECDVYSNEI